MLMMKLQSLLKLLHILTLVYEDKNDKPVLFTC